MSADSIFGAQEEKLRNAGGRAFPKTGAAYGDGMTLRDYFAAAALTGLIAYNGEWTTDKGNKPVTTLKGFVNEAYAFADAMIAKRAK